MKIKQLIGLCGILALTACHADIEPINQQFTPPAEQDPAAYADYLATLNNYKQSAHHTFCVRFDNTTAIVSEKESLRSLPDSLDIVALLNPLSKFDREDLATMHEKGTRVVLHVDCSDPATALSKVDAALAAIASDGLDGIMIAFWGSVTSEVQALSKTILPKVSALGKVALFEGNVAFVPAADRAQFAFYILDATLDATVPTLQSDAAYMTGFLNIPAAKILPAVKPFGVISDIGGQSHEACVLVPKEALTLSLGGLMIYDPSTDYYSSRGTYPHIRGAIDIMNPAHTK